MVTFDSDAGYPDKPFDGHVGRDQVVRDEHIPPRFAAASNDDCVTDLFFGTDYHSHLDTRRGGLAVMNGGSVNRLIHDITLEHLGKVIVLRETPIGRDRPDLAIRRIAAVAHVTTYGRA